MHLAVYAETNYADFYHMEKTSGNAGAQDRSRAL